MSDNSELKDNNFVNNCINNNSNNSILNSHNNIKYKYKNGLIIGSVNARGLISNVDDRVNLYSWIIAHDVDAMCVQEWYVHHKDNNKEFDTSLFHNYNIMINKNNTKTMIIFKKELKHEKLYQFNCELDGLDVTWLAIFTRKYIVVIGSIYHSPNKEYDNYKYNIISQHMKDICKYYNNDNRKVVFNINGDFNSKHICWGSNETDKRGNNAMDWITSENLYILNDGSPTYINSHSKIENVLDLSLISMDIKNNVERWSIHKDLRINYNFSDHYVLQTLVNINPIFVITPNKITWNFDKSKINDFKNDLKDKMNIWYQQFIIYKDDENMVDHLVNLFQLLFVQSSIDIFGFKVYNDHQYKWVTNKLLNLIEKKKKLKRKFSRLMRQIKRKTKMNIIIVSNIPRKLRIYWKKLKNQINKVSKQIQKNKVDTIIDSTRKLEKAINQDGAKCDRTFWGTVNKITAKTREIIPPQRDNETDKIVASTTDEIANHLHRHFIQPVKQNKYEARHTQFHNHVTNYINNYKCNRNNNNSIVNREISKQEIMKVINNLNGDSAMGFDFVHFKLVKWSKSIIIDNLYLLYNLCFVVYQHCPKIWKYGEYIPVPKPGRPHHYSKNIRPIMIIPGLSRIFSKIIANRLLTDCIQRGLLDVGNCGFQSNKATQDIFLGMTEKIHQAIENGHFEELTVMDLGSAYDSVCVDMLLYKLKHDYGLDGNIIAWYLSELKDRKTRVLLDGTVTPWRDNVPNLPQGKPDSCPLFILFFNQVNVNKSINKKYRNKNNQIYDKLNFKFNIDISTFADDCTLEQQPIPIKIPMDNYIKYRQREALQMAINDLYEWTLYYKLIISIPKCSTISFSKKTKKFNAYVYKLNGKSLELVHAINHSPQKCKHSERIQYTDGALRLDDKYIDMLVEGNGDSDLENMDDEGNKIVENVYPSPRFRINPKSKQQQEYHNQLSTNVRILGVHFDPKFFFNEHFKIIMKKVAYKLYCLRRLAYSKYYNFSAHTIFRLFESVIQPKMEYALCTVYNSNLKIKILEKIQIKAAKLALRLKRDTRTDYIRELLNIQPIAQRIDMARIKLWHRYKRACPGSLQHNTFNKWKEYILNNGGNINTCIKLRNRQIGRDESFTLNGTKFKYIHKSPLSQAYHLLDKILPTKQKIFSKRVYDVCKPPPTYNMPFPPNIKSHYNYKYHMNGMKYNLWNFYTDGSVIPNPGPGGSGYYSPDFGCEARIYSCNHDTTINYSLVNNRNRGGSVIFRNFF